MPPRWSCWPRPLCSAGSGREAGYARVPLSPGGSPTRSRPEPVGGAKLAARKVLSYLIRRERHGHYDVERSSVYGAALAIPQIARSAGWPATMTALAIRAYVFLGFNYVVQGFLISVMNEEAHVMSPFKAQMHLCDFGASIASCPSGANCRGPGGTAYSFSRLHDFGAWSTRVFVRDALKAIFPEREAEVLLAADPGEYGLEDYYCRLVCCLIFMMNVVGDLHRSVGLAWLLVCLPSGDHTWIRYEVPDWGEGKEQAKKVFGWSELDLVKFSVSGMTRYWKAVNVIVILLPKVYIWGLLVVVGFHFLMETAGIVDLVINCMALSFVLGIDEMLFERLATLAARHVMERLEEFSVAGNAEDEADVEGGPWAFLQVLMLVVPMRLFVVVAMMVLFLGKYYYTNCRQLEDGSWVSRDVYMPVHVGYNPLSFIYGALLEQSPAPLWSMPPEP